MKEWQLGLAEAYCGHAPTVVGSRGVGEWLAVPAPVIDDYCSCYASSVHGLSARAHPSNFLLARDHIFSVLKSTLVPLTHSTQYSYSSVTDALFVESFD
jgi:hypothetical protein